MKSKLSSEDKLARYRKIVFVRERQEKKRGLQLQDDTKQEGKK